MSELKKIRPLKNYLLVKPEKHEGISPGGIIMPGEEKKRANIAVVISVGPNVENLRPQDRIFFGKYSTTDIKIHGETLLLIKEEDVMGVLHG